MPLPTRMLLHDAVTARIKNLAEEQGYSMERLSQASGVPKSTITDYLRGASCDIKLETLVKIANGFGMTLRDFINDDCFDLIDVALLL